MLGTYYTPCNFICYLCGQQCKAYLKHNRAYKLGQSVMHSYCYTMIVECYLGYTLLSGPCKVTSDHTVYLQCVYCKT